MSAGLKLFLAKIPKDINNKKEIRKEPWVFSQHMGLGKKLMKEAEKIAKKEKCSEIKVISGIGVREYYKNMGYKLKEPYMIKKI